ncbi:hypothetical protein KZX37_05935 [Microbacterium sp. EYE_5]|uniref:hypothetical protein n=1 Tax=unclassified Microbacterium TaxID=2609290 RepID=UPI002004D2F1|nr:MULTISPECIES: hypothetical protein [unclassified Microbacterium]MCK6080161.1 hypothetical protein [Microbacterium sp. EYE_382]MCK6085432.1 hypothetical protein [Microbacterium sp. EYE_384]MCK6122343.1 hypothetical protein [Microbacterium sp. EYE_80]MCK6126195.1 hypothetical protein [Microbacterium sp. EYE_79]MCK6141116.1 hypothetical protein [Microbacterium sp. EYE_39]
MSTAASEHDLTLWFDDGVPARMFFGRRRWEVTDMPTPLPSPVRARVEAWRFQATDPSGQSFVFDVYREGGHWHVHRAYS